MQRLENCSIVQNASLGHLLKEKVKMTILFMDVAIFHIVNIQKKIKNYGRIAKVCAGAGLLSLGICLYSGVSAICSKCSWEFKEPMISGFDNELLILLGVVVSLLLLGTIAGQVLKVSTQNPDKIRTIQNIQARVFSWWMRKTGAPGPTGLWLKS